MPCRAAGSVDLHGFSVVYQRVWERLAAIKGERAAFDHFDSDEDGLLVASEIIEALEPLLPRLPDEQQLRNALRLGQAGACWRPVAQVSPAMEDPSDEDDETIAVIDTGRHLRVYEALADLDVPFEKQQELLQVWPISESYIQSLDASAAWRAAPGDAIGPGRGPASRDQLWPKPMEGSHELIEMLSNFLGVKPEQNLRELSYPVSSFRKLRERAKLQQRLPA
eukprot:Skav224906  [mRNA]  locus=scaffold1112:460186:465051:- [translate_table: standard]